MTLWGKWRIIEYMNESCRKHLEPYLRAGEALLWSGRPIMQWWDDRNALWIGLGALLLVLACSFALVDPNTLMISPEIFITMVLLGLIGVVGLPFVRYRQKRHMVYGLTNERAIVLTRRGVKSYPLKPYMVVEHEPAQGGSPGKLMFAHKEFLCYPVDDIKEGFLNLADTAPLLQLLREHVGPQLFARDMPAGDREAAEQELAVRIARHPLCACMRFAVDAALVLFVVHSMYYAFSRRVDIGAFSRRVDIGNCIGAYIEAGLVGVMLCWFLLGPAWQRVRVFLLGRRLVKAGKAN